MNQIPKRDRYTEEVARIREVVERHALPKFVTGFDVRLGDFDDEPAMWITFHVTSDADEIEPNIDRQTAILETLRHAIQSDLLAEFNERFPFFRFSDLHLTTVATG